MGPLEDEGGVVFSLSVWTMADKSLLDLFFFANMADRLEDDLDFFGEPDDSSWGFLLGDRAVRISILVFDGVRFFCRLLEGDEDGD